MLLRGCPTPFARLAYPTLPHRDHRHPTLSIHPLRPLSPPPHPPTLPEPATITLPLHKTIPALSCAFPHTESTQGAEKIRPLKCSNWGQSLYTSGAPKAL